MYIANVSGINQSSEIKRSIEKSELQTPKFATGVDTVEIKTKKVKNNA